MHTDYLRVKNAWTAGELQSLADILKFIDKSLISRDLGISPSTLAKRFTHPGMLNIKEYLRLSKLTGIPKEDLLEWIASATDQL